jgi:hypothetical protein
MAAHTGEENQKIYLSHYKTLLDFYKAMKNF